MKVVLLPYMTVVILMSVACVARSDGLVFGLVSKNVDDINFITAWKACSKAAQIQGDTCVHIGGSGSSQFRGQDIAISAALEAGIDGLAVSVTNSAWLAQHSLMVAKSKNIPTITFDSDVEPQHSSFRSAYIGPDNIQFGKDLAHMAQRIKPDGGQVWLMSGSPHDTNLNQRLAGVRIGLSGNDAYSAEGQLNGENGWRENPQSPWYCWDEFETTQLQLHKAFNATEMDVFISVGGWPLENVSRYTEIVEPLMLRLISGEAAVLIGYGAVGAPQKQLLQSDQVQGYVVIDFEEMGRLAYENLRKLAQGGVIPKAIYTKNKLVLKSSSSL